MAQPSPDLAILGSWPPPTGGVAVHVRRLAGLLATRGVHHVVFNATSDVGDGRRVISVYRRRNRWLTRYLLTGREPAIYLLSDRLAVWLATAAIGRLRGKRMMVRLRNSRLTDWVANQPWKAALAGWALRRMDGLVCVNPALADTCIQLGVNPRRVHWIPGFLPPVPEDIQRAGVAQQVWPFVESHDPVLCANGKVSAYRGQDLYGFDHLVELTARLKPDYPRIGTVVCFWQHLPSEQPGLDKLNDRARALGVVDNILFNTAPGSFVPVIAASNAFIRPTNTDGDANSIREAIHLGVPAVASDVVQRPAGAILFPTRDLNAMELCVRRALQQNRRSPATPRPISADDGERVEKYLNLLERFARGDAATLPASTSTPTERSHS